MVGRLAVTSENASLSAVFKVKGAGEGTRDSAEQLMPISQAETISARGNITNKDVEGDVQLTINRAGTHFPPELPSAIAPRRVTSTANIVNVKALAVVSGPGLRVVVGQVKKSSSFTVSILMDGRGVYFGNRCLGCPYSAPGNCYSVGADSKLSTGEG